MLPLIQHDDISNIISRIVYIVAGEPSGDCLGASLISEINKNTDNIKVCGVGGVLMKERGLSSLFNIEDISVMGFLSVALKAKIILKRLKQTKEHILETNPDVLVTIDSPGFCFRLVKDLRKLGFKKPCIHYVGPSVWVWKAYRAKQIAGLFDHLMCLFPFEPKYFKDVSTSFVGHPVYNTYLNQEKNIKDEFLILPGSRAQEVKTHLPIFLDAVNLIETNYKKKIVTLENLKPLVEKILSKYNLKDKIDISFDRNFSKGVFAIACNGTVALELAAYNVQFVSAYKVSWPLYFILKKNIKTPYINLINILLQKSIVPEIIQCNSSSLKHAIDNLAYQNFDDAMILLKGETTALKVISSYL